MSAFNICSDFIPKSHSFGAIINLIIVLIYSIYSGYLRIGLGDGVMYWILFMTALPNIQLDLLGIERIFKHKS